MRPGFLAENAEGRRETEEIALSLEGSYDAYLWSTSETTATIVVDPESPQWYWVTVTSAGGCKETASVLVRPKPPYEEQTETQ